MYFTALQLGPTTVLKISRKSEIKRSTVYSVIETLVGRGIILREVRGSKEYLVAARPEKLEKLLEERRQAFQTILPNLQALHKLEGSESVIKHYEGIESLKSVYLDLLQSIKIGQDYLVLSELARWQKLEPSFFQNFIDKRAKLNINVRMVLVANTPAKKRAQKERRANEATRLLPPTSELTTNLVITPKRVFVHSLSPPLIGMVIENQSFIQMYREMFEIIWQSLASQ